MIFKPVDEICKLFKENKVNGMYDIYIPTDEYDGVLSTIKECPDEAKGGSVYFEHGVLSCHSVQILPSEALSDLEIVIRVII